MCVCVYIHIYVTIFQKELFRLNISISINPTLEIPILSFLGIQKEAGVS